MLCLHFELARAHCLARSTIAPVYACVPVNVCIGLCVFCDYVSIRDSVRAIHVSP